MIDGSEKRNRQLAFELQNSYVSEKSSNENVKSLSEHSVLSLTTLKRLVRTQLSIQPEVAKFF